MYKPVQMSNSNSKNQFLEQFNINIFSEDDNQFFTSPAQPQFITEAVFTDGKKQLDGILQCCKAVHDELVYLVECQEEDIKNKVARSSIRKFDPEKFWKSDNFKKLEDEIKKVFGFRIVTIEPWVERYIGGKNKDFESYELNCYVYNIDRYPIEAIVTDKGFYDKSNSLSMNIYVTLGLLYKLEPAEILGVFLHEFGHGVDPALVNIKYAETNILSKYLTDRKGSLTPAERKVLEKNGKKRNAFTTTLVELLQCGFIVVAWLIGFIIKIFNCTKFAAERRLKKLTKQMRAEEDEFNMHNFSEAFADNFARMYGYSAQCMNGLRKINKKIDEEIKSYYWLESSRRDAILKMTAYALKDVHKTEIHRIHALIKEYEKDIAQPNLPDQVKKNLTEDKEELEKVLDMYLHDFSKFQNHVNQVIYDELKKEDELRDEQEKKDKLKTESTEYNTMIESFETLANKIDTLKNSEMFQEYDERGKNDEYTKNDNSFTIYSITFEIPEVSGWIDRDIKDKLDDEFKNKVKQKFINCISKEKNIKKIESIIYDEEHNNSSDSKNEIIKQIKTYLSKSKADKLLCTKSGKCALRINIPYIKNVSSAWMEHEMWITSDAKVLSYDDIEFMK